MEAILPVRLLEGAGLAEASPPNAGPAVRAATVCGRAVVAFIDHAIPGREQVLACRRPTCLRNSQFRRLSLSGAPHTVATSANASNRVHDNSFRIWFGFPA